MLPDRVTIVDDDPGARALVVTMLLLTVPDMDVREAAGQAEAKLLDWRHGDVALIDWRLPDGSGTVLASWLQATAPLVRLVVFSGAEVAAVRADLDGHGLQAVPAIWKADGEPELLAALGVVP